MLDKRKKEQIINSFKSHAKDTGGTAVQIAILTAEVEELTEHLKEHRKDFSSRRGLFRKVAQRKRLLRYLEREDEDMFDKVVSKLGLKIAKREVIDHHPDDTEDVAEDIDKIEL